ncbi:M16 family metallopeptidase [Flavivirga algicola]|uniref:Insulinase family protein n=1 Tax=Flavivirga algicola TaxID=2729136 RepID=A0ABX1S5M9_9FLAO|nr:insulinase family protein [Flavivirga algicola]NMH89845.1 insulinase family protein [Flavivirga algicola]
MQNILSVISFLLIINVLLLLFSVNSDAQSLNLNDTLQMDQTIKKGVSKHLRTLEGDTILIPFEDLFNKKKLLSGIVIKQGSIISESMLQSTGSTTFTLSNGIKVHYKYVNKNKDNIQFNALSHGGFSLVSNDDLPSAQLLENMVALSGIGNYSTTDLSKILIGKTAHTRVHLSDLTESITGASVTKDVETLLQMVYLRFVKPRLDTDAYQILIRNLNNDIVRRRRVMDDQVNDSIITTLYGNRHPRRRLFNNDFVRDVSFDKIKKLYKERFNNAADFEFFIVGDIQKGNLRPLLERYIASIPTNDVKEVWKDNSVPWLRDTTHKDISLMMKIPKKLLRIEYKNIMPYSLKNVLIARVLGDILQLRFIEKLQEQATILCKTIVKSSVSEYPIEQASLYIAIDCNPVKVEQFLTVVRQEIEKIENGIVAQTDLDKIKAAYLEERKQQQFYNSYDMCVLINYFREGYHMNDPKNFEDIVNAITIKDVELFTKALIKDSKSYEIVFSPDSTCLQIHQVKGMVNKR